jgi:hypothetical protein
VAQEAQAGAQRSERSGGGGGLAAGGQPPAPPRRPAAQRNLVGDLDAALGSEAEAEAAEDRRGRQGASSIGGALYGAAQHPPPLHPPAASHPDRRVANRAQECRSPWARTSPQPSMPASSVPVLPMQHGGRWIASSLPPAGAPPPPSYCPSPLHPPQLSLLPASEPLAGPSASPHTPGQTAKASQRPGWRRSPTALAPPAYMAAAPPQQRHLPSGSAVFFSGPCPHEHAWSAGPAAEGEALAVGARAQGAALVALADRLLAGWRGRAVAAEEALAEARLDVRVGCGVWGVGCGVWGVGCGVWDVGCGGEGVSDVIEKVNGMRRAAAAPPWAPLRFGLRALRCRGLLVTSS